MKKHFRKLIKTEKKFLLEENLVSLIDLREHLQNCPDYHDLNMKNTAFKPKDRSVKTETAVIGRNNFQFCDS